MLVGGEVEFVFMNFGNFFEVSFYLEVGSVFDMVVFNEYGEVVYVSFIFELVKGVDIVVKVEGFGR